jgi:hypothetical protein
MNDYWQNEEDGITGKRRVNLPGFDGKIKSLGATTETARGPRAFTLRLSNPLRTVGP